jgi:cytochrome c biogenesis protein
LRNFPKTWKAITRHDPVLEDINIKALPLHETFSLQRSLDEAREQIAQALKSHFSVPQETERSNAHHFFAEKAKYSRLGVYITHISVVTILAGGLIGALFGFRGHVNIVEGNTVDRIVLSNNSASYELGFSLLCEDFEVTFYPSGAPKDYKSVLTVLEDGKEVLTKTIEVNHPLQYGGLVFYQSSYGTFHDESGEITLLAKKRGEDDQGSEFRVEVGDSFRLPDGGPQVEVSRYVPDFALSEDKKVFSRSNQPNNPAVELLLSDGNPSPERIWVFQRFPEFHGSRELPYQFMLQEVKGKEFTGLQVTKDPGVWVVWIGCGLMVAGILLTFFLSHRKMWVRVRRDQDVVEVTVAGTSSKNRLGFEKEFDALKKEIQGND